MLDAQFWQFHILYNHLISSRPLHAAQKLINILILIIKMTNERFMRL